MGCPAEVEIGSNLVFSVTTHTFSTGALTDADADPPYRVYEDETGTAILTGTMSKLDDANTTGFYSESIACTSANGFENGKTYTIYVTAVVSSLTGGISFGFKAYDRRKVDVDTIKTQAVTCAAGVTVLASVGTASTSTAQTGDSYAIVNSGTYGNSAIKTQLADIHDTDLAGVITKIGTITNTGGTASIGAILGDFANSALVTRVADLHTDIADNHTDIGTVITNVGTVDTVVDAIKVKTDYLPSATAGSAGGVFIAGSNAATTVNFTGNLSGSVGSVTGAVGSVTGAVGSVTAAVTISAGSVDLIWDEPVAGHTTASTFGLYLGGAPTIGSTLAADIANVHTDVGTAITNLATVDTVVDGIEVHVHQTDSRIVGTLATGTHNPQTGDSYAIVNSGTYGNSAIKTQLADIHDTDLAGVITKIGTITNTGGTATIGAILGDFANSALVTRVADLHTDVADVHTDVGTTLTNLATVDTVVDGIETHVHQIDSRVLGTVAAGTHNAQSGDSYAIVNSGTYGNSAIKTQLADIHDTDLPAVKTVADGIEVHVHQTDSRVIGTIATGTHNPQTGDSYTIVNSGTYGNSAIKTELDAVQAQVGNVATTGATSYQAASSFTKTTGGTETGTYANTDTSNGTYHQIPDSAGTTDIYYEYSLRPDEEAVGVVFKGRIMSSNDTVVCEAYDWLNTAWVTLFTLAGTNATTDSTFSPALVGKYTGTSAPNVGKVHIRFYGTGLTTSVLYVDQCIVAKARTDRTVGYSQGAIWIDSTGGTSGTTAYYNGTADHPVSTWADALTLASSLNIHRFQVAPATAITLSADSKKYAIGGKGYTLNLNGKDISYMTVDGCEYITGTGTCADWEAFLWNCQLGATTLGETDLHNCHITDMITLSSTSPMLFNHCVGVPIGSPGIDFGSAVGATPVVCGGCGGVWEIRNMKTGDILYFDGAADVTLAASCTGGTVYLSGGVRLTNNGSGQTIHDEARVHSTTEHADAVLTRDFASVTGEASRSALNALRFLRNKWAVSGTTLSVKKEDDSTEAWSSTLSTDTEAEPIVGSDPA